tara:strand:+ start:240 stop:875 length:636 start_codon:yes stop_codon:yes gene_type:complete
MGVPRTYRKSREAIASFDGFDLASGVGIKVFYAGDTENEQVMSDVSFYSKNIFTSGKGTTTTLTKKLDVDFDIKIKNTMTINGTSIVNLPMAFTFLNGAFAGQAQFFIKLRKYSDTTETDIASNNTELISGNNNSYYRMGAFYLDIPPTKFKKDDLLRLTVEGWAKINTLGSGDGTEIKFAHDPKNRTEGWDSEGDVPSSLIIQMPIKIQV